jgi:hypothetical protein
MSDAWRDIVAGDRLALDQEFQSRVREAGLSSQEWGLVMTAVEFEVEDPGDPETAELVADTSRLGAVLPQMKKVREQAGGPGGGDTGTGGDQGVIDSAKRLLGLGDDERRGTAEELAAEYATRLQERLMRTGRWEHVCAVAAGE